MPLRPLHACARLDASARVQAESLDTVGVRPNDFRAVQVEELAGKLCKPAASLLLPGTLAAALWPGAQNFPDVEAVLSTQLVSVDTFNSSRNAHLLTLHLPRCTHRFCMRMWTWCGQTEKIKMMATHR